LKFRVYAEPEQLGELRLHRDIISGCVANDAPGGDYGELLESRITAESQRAELSLQQIWYIFKTENGCSVRRAASMAQKVQVLLVDDLDGSEATETVAFGLDGASYEIDLSTGNAGKLRKELASYVEHARKANAPAAARRRRARTGPGRERSAQIRAWAKQRGYKVNERGRIPANIVAEYEAAH
jgi:hypothetical protein